MKNKKTNEVLLQTLEELKKTSREKDAPIWRDVADRLEAPASRWAYVNVSKIERNANQGETALVPGKLLASGELKKRIDVAAWAFSEEARRKVSAAGGKCYSISDILRHNPDGKNVRIVV